MFRGLRWAGEVSAPRPLTRGAAMAVFVTVFILSGTSSAWGQTTADGDLHAAASSPNYVVLAWNDLGMHCYNQDFQDLAVLPPYNTLWAQVIEVGDPPQIVTGGITVTYGFADNTYSVGKSNFWQYDLPLFGVDLPDNIGLKGKGLAGAMDPAGNHFEAVGIPLTEFRDSQPLTPYPYQLATVTVFSATTGVELTRVTAVAPVSTEMHCDNCHDQADPEAAATRSIATNILALHDEEEGGNYPAGHTTLLMQRRPVLCAECHASNALGAPGLTGVPSLSNAMHAKHAEEVPNSVEGCYNCHPGPTTKCLRDVMSQQEGMGCPDCHGTMQDVAQNATPWFVEPRCDACHDDGTHNQDQALYRMSSGHGGISCAGCHDSPHAIAPSREANDAIKFMAWQGHAGPVDSCTVCHATQPTAEGPHGLMAPPVLDRQVYLPAMAK